MGAEKRFYIQTLGCKVNQYESQLIREGFLRGGYIEAAGVDEADVCIVNTCTVTSTSDSKSLRLIRSGVKKQRCVIATGCMVEDKDLDFSRLKGVRYIIRNRDKYKIPQLIDSSTIPDSCLDFARDRRLTINGIRGLKDHTRVFVKVQDGCDNACSYCKVRVVRGHSRSRPFKEVLDECEDLIRNGSKEIVLTGICLGAYGKDLSKGMDLCKLVDELCRIDGDWRLRLSSIEPKDISERLIQRLCSQKRLCRHLHMPFQSGDDHVLKEMHRPYTRDGYLDIVKRIKGAVPDIAISTDMMVGFPGETEKRFQDTVDFIKDVRPMRMHVFPFSKRKGTKAYNYKDNITGTVKKQREDRLLRLAKELSMEFVCRFVDREVKVLVEHKRSSQGLLQGYTDTYIKVYIDGPDALKGRFANPCLTLTNRKVYGILFLHSICSPF